MKGKTTIWVSLLGVFQWYRKKKKGFWVYRDQFWFYYDDKKFVSEKEKQEYIDYMKRFFVIEDYT